MKAVETSSSRGERTRQSILEAALKLFLSQGYNGTSMRQIAQEAGGIAVSGIYNHFTGKEDIFRALMEAHSPYPRLIAHLNRLHGDSGMEIVRDVFEFAPRLMLESVDFIRLALIDAQEFEGTTVRRLLSEVIPYILATIQRNQEAGILRSDVNPVAMMLVFGGAMFGYVLSCRFGITGENPLLPNVQADELREMLIDLYLHGAAAQERGA